MLAQFILSGIVVGCIYALVAIGFTMIYNATETVNFAVGESMMLGAYFILTFYKLWEMPYWLALVLTLGAAGLVGYVVFDRIVSRPLISAPMLSRVIALLGLATVLKGVARLIWGADAYHLPSPISSTPLHLGTMLLTLQEAVIIGSTVVVICALYGFFYFTRLGQAMRATAQSRRAASLMGVNVPLIFSITWIIGTVLSAFGGVLLGPLLLVDPDMGDIGMKSFTAAVLGGFGSIPGAILGGILLGIAENLVAGYLRADLQTAATFVLLLAVLAIRPTGMFGASLERRV
ncbi:branched-chain amino acid transport system permease protein [Rhodoligotrophos appendicifer]|uniref:branched-chain amino acid ABC transporter permease n=1 Tax=Rhodoligotrophos appendicifer TaxID=987056 RepID=UPI0011866949|nr:branched-chain amino acid ABC transporter permease [Rhodoligotrophos appendicifer]